MSPSVVALTNCSEKSRLADVEAPLASSVRQTFKRDARLDGVNHGTVVDKLYFSCCSFGPPGPNPVVFNHPERPNAAGMQSNTGSNFQW